MMNTGIGDTNVNDGLNNSGHPSSGSSMFEIMMMNMMKGNNGGESGFKIDMNYIKFNIIDN